MDANRREWEAASKGCATARSQEAAVLFLGSIRPVKRIEQA
jgi:hypothetical protein